MNRSLLVMAILATLTPTPVVAKDKTTQKIEACVAFKAQQYAKLCESAATVAEAIAHHCAPAPLMDAPSKDQDWAADEAPGGHCYPSQGESRRSGARARPQDTISAFLHVSNDAAELGSSDRQSPSGGAAPRNFVGFKICWQGGRCEA